MTKRKIAVAPIAGRARGNAIDLKVLNALAPSILATSNISFGRSLIKAVMINIEIGNVRAIFTSIKPISEFVK